MQTLLNIRLKYIVRRPCLFFWVFLFIPIIIAIVFSSLFAAKKKVSEEYHESFPLQGNKTFLGDNYDYTYIKSSLSSTGFLVPDKANCDIINALLKEHAICYPNNCPVCSDKESDFEMSVINVIKIEKKSGKYNVELNMDRFNGKSSIFFAREDLDQDVIVDPYYAKEFNPYGKDTRIPYQIHTFFELQSLVSRILIKLEGKEKEKHYFDMFFGYNKYPESYPFTYVKEILAPHALLCFIFVLQFSLVNYNINMRMIDEKEAKLDIFLERQGISHTKYMFSWFFVHLVLFIATMVAFSIMAAQQSNGHAYLFIINIILFTLSLFSVSVLFTTCCKTVKNGSTAIKFYHFGSIFLGFAIILPKTLKFSKILFAFIPQINFYMNYYSTMCLGNFDKLSGDLVLLKAAKMSYIETIVMFFVEIIFNLLIAFFVHSYRRSGLPFCLYLKSCCVEVSRNAGNPNIGEEILARFGFDKYFQELSETNRKKLEANQCLKIVNVSKSFDDLKAVKSFCGELFTDEIYCLLGHNGAGKSTLVNMISGNFDPDEGDILLDGRSLVTDKNYLYQNIGLCQQEDIFFEHLTVNEHLEYMCKIKGSQVNRQEIDELINNLGLAPKKTARCNTLSGGQKRKLCIALALIGNSKLILLDEPTSGMDIMARKQLWEFLKRYKQNRIILLTTHFLDEAEYLGDRIGIMLDGQYMCCGTSSYIKSKYPCGFNINLLIDNKIFDDNKRHQFFREIKNYEGKAEIKINSKSVFSIKIPSENKNIREIFDYIERIKTEFGIQDYTVGSTSLEDVFLKLNNKPNLDITGLNMVDNSLIIPEAPPQVSSGCTQLCAHIVRNLYPFYRNKLNFFFELLAGIGFVYIFIFFFADLINNSMNGSLDLGEVLRGNRIYIHTKDTDKNFFKNSDVYDRYGNYMSLKELKGETNEFENFRTFAYDESLAHIAKGAINVIKEKRDNYNYYKVFNSEIYNGLYGYFFANTMLTVSAFLKESYGIDATIFGKITIKTGGTVGDSNEILTDSIVLIIVCLLSFFGYVIFLGGLMHEKIKEKRTHIKHLLYLSGNKLPAYWLGFYVADYIKLLFFTIILVAPLWKINGCATYFLVDLLFVNIAALSFVYFISVLCQKEEQGSRVLFSFIFTVVILLTILMIIAGTNNFLDKLINLQKPLVPTIYDITPFTSMVFNFIRMIISYSIFAQYEKRRGTDADVIAGFHKPGFYLASSFIAQLMNIVFYTLLLIIAESGCWKKCEHCCEQSYADNDIRSVPIAPGTVVNLNNNNNINNNNANSNINNSINLNNSIGYSINDVGNTNSNMQEPLIEQVPIENEINTSTNRNLYNTNIRNQQNNYGPYQNQYNNNQNQYQNNQYQNQYQNQYNNNQYQNNQMQYQRQNNQNQYQNNQYQNQYNQNQYPNQNQYQNNQYQKPNQNQYQNNQYQNNQYQNNQYQNNQYQNNQMQYQNNPNQYQNNQYRPLNNQMQYQNNQNQYNQVQYQNNQYQNQNQNMQVQYQNINNQNQFQNNQIQYQNQNNLINSYQNNQPENLDINLNGQNLTGNPLWNPYVQSEIQKVNSQQNLSTRIINVTKTFYPCCSCCGCCRKNKVRAINHLHLGLEENEKFGLLGFNGSGKTTTFRAITNEIMTDFGTINIFGHDTKKHFNSLRNMIGYCPQDNPLFDFMKVKEIIKFYSKLKTCNKSPEEICEKFGLSRYMDTYTVNLSGGNKRKLTFAIALMNKPTLLLLDEPSTGVDPESRRTMWKNINELSLSGHKYNMILTTHSLEEAEVLCDTVSWFRDGNFIALGNPEQLKLKYSVGYKLHIKFVEAEIKNQMQGGNVEQCFNSISSLVPGFNNYSNFIRQNPAFEPYMRNLIRVIYGIKDKTKKISLYMICKDYSFDLVIQIINERKKDLFVDILNMKNQDKTIEEISINMQSLENILTSL